MVEKMKIIGITGGSGAGKSTVCAELKKRGALIIDADKISREVSARGGAAFDEIVGAFGEEILSGGEIDRKRLGGIVFADREKLDTLNKITHKHIFAEMKRQLSGCRAAVAVLDVPLLFQDDFPIKCDLTVAVTAPHDVRIERIMRRDGIDRGAAEARLKNQISDAQYAEFADMCFENNGTEERLAELADRLIEN